MSERVSRSIVVGAAWKASRVPSGDQLGAPLTVRLPCATSLACFVATSTTHACESRKLPSNTCGSSRRAVFASSVLGSVSTARNAMRGRPRPGEAADALLGRRELIRFAAVHRQHPDLRLGVRAAAAARREERERAAVGRPLRRVLAALAEGDLARRAAGGADHPDVRPHSCLSPFAVSGLVGSVDGRALGCSQPLTVYATFDPSGESATPPTFLSSMMSMNVMGRLFCAPAVAVAAMSARTHAVPRVSGAAYVAPVWVGKSAMVGARLR